VYLIVQIGDAYIAAQRAAGKRGAQLQLDIEDLHHKSSCLVMSMWDAMPDDQRAGVGMVCLGKEQIRKYMPFMQGNAPAMVTVQDPLVGNRPSVHIHGIQVLFWLRQAMGGVPRDLMTDPDVQLWCSMADELARRDPQVMQTTEFLHSSAVLGYLEQVRTQVAAPDAIYLSGLTPVQSVLSGLTQRMDETQGNMYKPPPSMLQTMLAREDKSSAIPSMVPGGTGGAPGAESRDAAWMQQFDTPDASKEHTRDNKFRDKLRDALSRFKDKPPTPISMEELERGGGGGLAEGKSAQLGIRRRRDAAMLSDLQSRSRAR
jgi:hypothetical protein